MIECVLHVVIIVLWMVEIFDVQVTVHRDIFL